MKSEYRYGMNRRTALATATYLTVTALAAFILAWELDGWYIAVWFLLIAASLLGIAVISAPKRCRITDTAFEIDTLAGRTELKFSEIESVERTETKFLLPIWASIGFIGYFGLYFNPSRLKPERMYSTRWSPAFRITMASGNVYRIGFDGDFEVMETIEKQIGNGTLHQKIS